jgi:hypothetical protein
MRKHSGLYLLVLLFLLVAWLINPMRDLMIEDDWAYALTVRHLLATGEYKLNDWAAANMPVQIYWAAFLARIFGYTFGVLHCSTLLLVLAALIGLYFLLRDFGIADLEASLLTLIVFASPAVLFLSFTFQTDAQFLAWQILALWLYSRGLRQQRYLLMAAASLAASAAIGTRQFGVALVAGLLGTWLICERQPLRKIPLFLAGLLLPALIALWQFCFNVNQPTFTQKVRLAEQLVYLRDLPHLIGDILWRPTVILQYIGLFLLPLLPLLALLARKAWLGRDSADSSTSTYRRLRNLWLPGAWIAYVAGGICFGYFFYLRHVLMPYLAWLLPNAQTSPFGFKKHLALTLVTSGFAILLGSLLSQRYGDKQNWRSLPRAECFVMLSGLALLGLHLIYAQFYDVYLIQFLPFIVLALGQMLHAWPRWCKALTAVLFLLMLSISSLWSLGKLGKAQASWRAAEIARSFGAAPEEIGGDVHWNCYYGAFDDWVTKVGGPNAASRYIGSFRMHFTFFAFLEQRFKHAKYLVTPLPPDTSYRKEQLVGKVGYRDGWLRPQSIYIVRQAASD